MLELAGMAVAAGSALLEVMVGGIEHGPVAIAVGLALFGWALLTRVRRRLAAGCGTVLLAVAIMVAAPLAELVTEVRGPALWLVVAALGTILLLAAAMIERGRARARLAGAVTAAGRYLAGWE